MLWVDIVFIVIFAIILTGVLVWALGWRHPVASEVTGQSMLFLFLILLLAMWVGSAWIKPWGPVWYGSSWLSLLVIGLIFSLLILAVSAPPERGTRKRGEHETDPQSLAAVTIFGLFFWALIVILLLGVVMSLLP